MKKIMFNDKYGLTKAVLEGRKTMTRRLPNKNWERFRAETARMVLAAIVAKDDCRMTTLDNDVKYAVAYADELIRQLKDDNN